MKKLAMLRQCSGKITHVTLLDLQMLEVQDDVINFNFYTRIFELLNSQHLIISSIEPPKTNESTQDTGILKKVQQAINNLKKCDYAHLFKITDNVIKLLTQLLRSAENDQISLYVARLLKPLTQIKRIQQILENRRLPNGIFLPPLKGKASKKLEIAPGMQDEVICRICEKPVPKSHFVKHIETCYRAYQAQQSQVQIDGDMNKIIQEFKALAKIKWPVSQENILNVLVPLHMILLLKSALKTTDNFENQFQTCLSVLSTLPVVIQFTQSFNDSLNDLINRSIGILKSKVCVSYKSFQLNKEAQELTLSPSQSLSPSTSFSGQTDMSIASFTILKQISKGAYARVYLAEKNSTKDKYAIKVISKDKLHTTEIVKHHLLHEKDFLFQLRSNFIVKIYSSFIGEKNLYIVMDYISNGDLKHILDNYEVFDEVHATICTAQIVLALRDLRRNKFVHRDLKPDNVLLDGDGYLKLIDFGLSSEIMQNEIVDTTGTLGYCSPEVLTNQATTYSSDYWSLGCMIYEFLFGMPPFNAENATKTIENTLKINYEVDLSLTANPDNDLHDALDLISKLLVFEPEKRLGQNSFEDIMNHPWFKDIDWENVPELNDIEKPEEFNSKRKVIDTNSKEYLDIMSDMQSSQKIRNEFSSYSSCSSDEDDDFSKFNQVSTTYQIDKLRQEMASEHIKIPDDDCDDACPIVPYLTPRSNTPLQSMAKVVPSPRSPKATPSGSMTFE
ncbi:AGC family protein kinase [Trichomonas vaginalis G3]|uniref:non-specific serine/threonine protein kinase n=1 Tax=Trichomonas vaginalis (strain ATCC PRA-98 / G3) TaxID=412133 RepID=A2DH70_TRIV3|nr:protein kinase and peptidyl-serine phosphorylation [Trichomonas vaginalis G3]EAY20143.1 AGC family protein kinase [Trichomonas vaginalis G3]KAI5507610.1 protein kinase and peptidyl-serine phosphorylation [Trichomonas vaginalis G3]|eukprot:XP_001581129.1 AGC family protein kinase [Trichomonas vaginalis G3]